jgi:glyoxylase-like metal-dependent hydrolase (beta-lactamase superfamily II)
MQSTMMPRGATSGSVWAGLALGRALRALGLAALMAIGLSGRAWAVDLRFERVAENVYAFVGELGARTPGNEGLNANLGLVVTPAGALLIDSGATLRGARQIEAAVARVTPQPVRWVVNTGGQDHRWLGNGHFVARGAEVMAHAAGEADLRARGGEQLEALKRVLGPLADGTVPVLPTRWLRGADETLVLGGERVLLLHRGGAHTPGDLMVWLPAQGVLFSGDIVYVERLLGVLPVSHTRHWLASFDAIEHLAPRVLVPGHGRVTTLADARADTRDYLAALRAHMKRAVDDGQDIGSAIQAFDARRWERLRNAADLHPGNASRVYLELERE